MFNFFKSKAKNVNKSYPAVIQAIHNEFNLSGESLLKEAKDIISGMSVHNKQKSEDLKNLGFRNTKDVVQMDVLIQLKREKEKLANALEYFSVNYPEYKFITHDMAMSICKKYNLVLGEVSQYKGFVPKKNIDKIKKFFEEKNDLNTNFSISHSRLRYEKRVTKKEYEQEKESQKRRMELTTTPSYGGYENYYLDTNKKNLFIAAPLKDMETKGYKLKNRMFTREIPDPVVLCPVEYEGVKLYCIVTAWGDESSDEIVVNQQMN